LQFESGFERGGQTMEHTVLVRSLGVQQLIVAVNKMDNVDYSQDRYEHIKAEVQAFLKRAGYRKDDVTFVPVSGYKGENLLERKEAALNAWYCGPTLVELIDKLRPPVHPVDQPLRMVVSDIFKTIGLGVCLAGRLDAGYVNVGEQVSLRPGDITAVIKSIDRL
jgi:elongation factor 1 alpha-like protein